MFHSEYNEMLIIEIMDSLVEESEVLPLIRPKEDIAKIISQKLFNNYSRYLEVSINFDGDGHIYLAGSACIEGFSGYAEEYFSATAIQLFIEKITSEKFPAELSSGDYGANHELIHKNFSLVVSEIGSNGTYSVAIVLQNLPHSDCREESIMKFSSELMIGRSTLKNITDSLNKMIKGTQKSLLITG